MSPARRRIVAIGDLNGAADALIEILRGTGVVGRSGRWSGGTTHLIQMGDIFNRGDGAREALELLLRLRREAPGAGGEVSVLVGNHEVMTVLGNECYCTSGEYLAFAGAKERAAWPERERRAVRRILRTYPRGGPMPPFGPRLELWRALHAPGQRAMRRALGPRGRLGRAIRALPVAVGAGDAVFVHAGITPFWARHGVDGLNRMAARAWSEAPAFYARLDRRSILRARSGPLWSRVFAQGGATVERMLARSLALLGAARMVVGHTQTRHARGGGEGRILTRFSGRLACIDVGIHSGDGGPRAALVIEDGVGREWTPSGMRVLWRETAAATATLRHAGSGC